MTNLVTVFVLTDTLNETFFTTHLPEEHIPDDSWPRLPQQLKVCLNILFFSTRKLFANNSSYSYGVSAGISARASA
jgi:hypothetical protein